MAKKERLMNDDRNAQILAEMKEELHKAFKLQSKESFSPPGAQAMAEICKAQVMLMAEERNSKGLEERGPRRLPGRLIHK